MKEDCFPQSMLHICRLRTVQTSFITELYSFVNFVIVLAVAEYR